MKRDIGQDQEIILLALSMIACSEIVKWDIGIDSNERPIVTVNIFGPSIMVHFINLVMRKLTRVLAEKLAANADINGKQKISFMFGAAIGILNQAIDIDNKRNYLNAFEQAMEQAKNEPPEMYLDEDVRLPVTTRQIAAVLDEAKQADAMSYKWEPNSVRVSMFTRCLSMLPKCKKILLSVRRRKATHPTQPSINEGDFDG